MAESWVRLWSGMTLNAKWQTVARKSGQRRSLVIAMFTHLLMIANEAEQRGSVAGADIEDIASALDEDEEAVQAIWGALLGRAIDPETLRLTGWERFKATSETYRPSAEVWMQIRARIFERDDFTCCYCGARGGNLECDHVIPVSHGGSNDDGNLVTACRDCNRRKGARTPEQWRGE